MFFMTSAGYTLPGTFSTVNGIGFQISLFLLVEHSALPVSELKRSTVTTNSLIHPKVPD